MVNSVLGTGETNWTNQLGSVMKLISDGQGNLTGTYDTKVGEDPGPVPLVGQYNPDEEFPSMGWVVQWKHPSLPETRYSCTSWSAVLTTKDGQPLIHAAWILSTQCTPENIWDSHAVGCGEFVLDEVIVQ